MATKAQPNTQINSRGDDEEEVVQHVRLAGCAWLITTSLGYG